MKKLSSIASTAVLTLLLLLLESSHAFSLVPQNKKVTAFTSSSSRLQVATGIPTTSSNGAFAGNSEQQLSSDDYWIQELDYEGFQREVTALGKELRDQGGADDIVHLEKILKWRDWSMIAGILTMWLPVNPISVLALSTWTYSSWTMVAHHTCHGGYNRMRNVAGNTAKKFNSRSFALGSVLQRVSDWCDWMMPEAWNLEHNRLHHYHLGEPKDPDLVERNLEFLRVMDVPMWQKYFVVAFFIPVWKWFYYAPNTFKELQIQKFKLEGKPLPAGYNPEEALTVKSFFFPESESEVVGTTEGVVDFSAFFTKVLGPFLLTRFILLPAPLLLVPSFGPVLFGHALANLVLAELFTNAHAFLTIVTNHAGDDLYKFDDEVKPKTGSFYVRQIVSSANYDYGNDVVDFAHGWLNYQIEHHVWPDLSMLQYQKGAPKLRAICEKYGVPYIQESVFTRLRKTVDIMIGKSTMKDFPTSFEPSQHKAGNKGVTWKSTNGAIDEY